MARWAAADTIYRDVYIRTVERARQLPADLRAIVSRPHVMALTDEYLSSPTRVMIMGQETYGLDEAVTKHSAHQSYEIGRAGTVAFEFAEGGTTRQRSSPFWRAFRRVAAEFDLPAPHGVAWSNLVKVQCTSKRSASFWAIPSTYHADVLGWQRELFTAELRCARPHKLMLFTGPTYDGILAEMMPDLNMREVAGENPRKLMIGQSREFGCDVVRIYHPAYLRRIGAEDFVGEAAELLARAGSIS